MSRIITSLSSALILIGIFAHVLDYTHAHRRFVVMRMLGMENSQGWILVLIGGALLGLVVICTSQSQKQKGNK